MKLSGPHESGGNAAERRTPEVAAESVNGSGGNNLGGKPLSSLTGEPLME
jgi:hypothetical protein